MHRNARDPELNVLACQLRSLVWVNPLSRSEEQELTDCALAAGVGRKRRLVVPLPGYRDVAVRMHLGGEQRTIGITSMEQMPNAMRFADMAQMVFWKYRYRGASPPTEDRLNRYKKDVELDMLQETNAVALLKQIEKYLLETGKLQTGDERRAALKSVRKENLRSVVRGNHLELLEQVEAIHNRISVLESISKQLAEVAETQKLQIEALQGIARMVAHPPFVITAAPGLPPNPYHTGDPLPVNPVNICQSTT